MTIEEHLQQIEYHTRCVREMLQNVRESDVIEELRAKAKAEADAQGLAAAESKFGLPTSTEIIENEYEKQVAHHVAPVNPSIKEAGAY